MTIMGGTIKRLANGTLASAVTLGRPQIVATRCAVPNATRQGTASARTDLRIENRQEHYLGCQDVSQLQVAVAGYYLKNDTTGQHLLGNDFTYEAAVEITSPAAYREAFFPSTNLPSIESTTYGLSYLLSSPICFDLVKGGSFYMRQGYSVATDTLLIPSSTQQAASGTDTGFLSPSIVSQVAGTGAMTSPSGGTSFGGTPPLMILGVPNAPMACACILGDSIADGTGDTVDAYGNMGYLARGLFSVNGYPVPWIKNTVPGDKLSVNTLSTSPLKRDTWPFVTHLICELGTNDIAGSTLAQLQTYYTNLWTAAKRVIGPYGKPLQVVQTYLWPKTTSTDSWATAVNQTCVLGYEPGGKRDQLHAWFLTQLAAGAIDAVINQNVYVEDANNKWLTNGAANYPTIDGIHPTMAFHILGAQAVTAYGLTMTP